MRHRLAFLILLPGIALSPLIARAQWQVDGVPISAAANDQFLPTIVSDGAGGAIVTWMDRRNGVTTDIYVQRVNSSGAPLWTADGVALCTAANNQEVPTIVTDGAGGAIVTWQDPRNAFVNDIYAQRVNAAGVPLWTADGVAMCAAAFDQIGPEIVSDGAGGAIITWYDYRGVDIDIYAQRVSDLGTPYWAADGVALCAAANNQYYPTIAADGAGGAIVAWIDRRSGFVIYSQRVSDLGTPQWTADGIAVYTAAGNQEFPTIVSDGTGGAIFIWQDLRSGVSYDIYTQRVSNLGTPLWTANGVALCTAASSQFSPTLVPDGAGGAIVTWYDYRNGANFSDIYAQRVNNAGVPEWTSDGVTLSTAAGTQQYPTIASDGAGGAIVTWRDRRSGTNLDIYAQRMDVSGTPQWTADGVAVCTAALDQTDPVIVSDGAGGAIMAWQDLRSGSSLSDIYAQHVKASGGIWTAVAGPTRGPSLIVGEVFPNPFTGATSMDIQLTTPSAVHIEVFDVAGRTVRTMTLSDAAWQHVEFDGRDDANHLLVSGVYFCRIQAAGESITRKMVIAR